MTVAALTGTPPTRAFRRSRAPPPRLRPRSARHSAESPIVACLFVLPGTAMAAIRIQEIRPGVAGTTTTTSPRTICAAFVVAELCLHPLAATTKQPTTGSVRRHVTVSRAVTGHPGILASRWRPHTAVTVAAATVHQHSAPRFRRSQRIQPFRQPRRSLRPQVRYRLRPQPEQSQKTSTTRFVLWNASLVTKLET